MYDRRLFFLLKFVDKKSSMVIIVLFCWVFDLSSIKGIVTDDFSNERPYT